MEVEGLIEAVLRIMNIIDNGTLMTFADRQNSSKCTLCETRATALTKRKAVVTPQISWSAFRV